MISVHDSSEVDRGFESRYRVKPTIIKFVMRCFSAKHSSLRRKCKDWLARNQNDVFEWSDIISPVVSVGKHYKKNT